MVRQRLLIFRAEKIIGLSKINRIVRFFSQRPQVQERLTQQVLVALQTLLESEDVASLPLMPHTIVLNLVV